MTAIKLRKTVQNGGIFIPLSKDLDNQEVEVTVRPIHLSERTLPAEVAEAFFSKITVRSTRDFDPYDQ